MSGPLIELRKPPIVEAVLDLICDMPPGFDLSALESSCHDCFNDRYPIANTQHFQEQRIELPPNSHPSVVLRHGVQAFQFLDREKKQLVQVRSEGFSFNRLAPYTHLNDYIPEIQRTWNLFLQLAAPIQIRAVQLRYINRILLPMEAKRVLLDDYLKTGPRLPDEKKLTFVGFLNQHSFMEVETGNQANVILAAQEPENEILPIIFDITTVSSEKSEPNNWNFIMSKVQSLRNLKNLIFQSSLTQKCLNLFQ